MENKRNEATNNRPDGDRVIDAPYVFADINEFTRQLKEEDAWKKNDRNAITVFKSDTVTMVLVCLHEKALIKHNSIDGAVTVQLIEGKIGITTADGDIDLRPGHVIAFHPRIDHSIEAVDDAVLLMTIHKS